MLLGTKIDNRWWAGIQPPQFKHEMGLMDSLRKGVPNQWEQRSPSWTGVHQNNCCPRCNAGGLGTSWSWSWVWSERPAPLSLPEQEGLEPGKGQQGCLREIQESLLSSKHTLWFSGLFGPLVASVGAWWSTELLDIFISVCLSWAEAVSENESDLRVDNYLIVKGHASCGKSTHQINLYTKKGHYEDYQLSKPVKSILNLPTLQFLYEMELPRD